MQLDVQVTWTGTKLMPMVTGQYQLSVGRPGPSCRRQMAYTTCCYGLGICWPHSEIIGFLLLFWYWFTWWFNHLPGPSICRKRTPMTEISLLICLGPFGQPSEQLLQHPLRSRRRRSEGPMRQGSPSIFGGIPRISMTLADESQDTLPNNRRNCMGVLGRPCS